MQELIAYCGLARHECGAFIATLNDDDDMQREIARLWLKEHKTDLEPKDINCAGCTSTSENLFRRCKVCDIRRCGMNQEIANRAFCDEYTCQKLTRFFEMVPAAKQRLDAIRAEGRESHGIAAIPSIRVGFCFRFSGIESSNCDIT